MVCIPCPGCHSFQLTNVSHEACAATAGLAAYLISLGKELVPEINVNTPQGVKDTILELAWNRVQDKDGQKFKYIYNGVRPSEVGSVLGGPVGYPYSID